MNDPSEAVRASYAACRQMARGARSNFYTSFLFLPADKRRAMDALYAFTRRTDDLADSHLPLDARRESLTRWRGEVAAALAEGHSGDCEAGIGSEFLPALADAVRRFRIPAEHLEAVIDGVEMDLDERRYETFAELTEYCHRVASAVGLACIYIWGFRSSEAVHPARQCGVALQLTNILRDLREDAREGRIYLPLEDFRLSGYSPEELAAGVVDERFSRLVRLEIGRAERLYREGAELIDWLHPDGRRALGTMVTVYHRLLEKIERDPAAVMARRIRLGRWEKLRIAARGALLPPNRAALP